MLLCNIDNNLLSSQQLLIRENNHGPSAKSKATTSTPAIKKSISIGSLVYIKAEVNKFKVRECYIVMQVRNDMTTLQKLNGSLFSSTRYDVPVQDIFPVVPDVTDDSNSPSPTFNPSTVTSDSDDEHSAHQVPPDTAEDQRSNRPCRTQREPAWLHGEEWEKE